MVSNIERPVHHRFAGSAENIAIISESVAEDPNVSISRRSRSRNHDCLMTHYSVFCF